VNKDYKVFVLYIGGSETNITNFKLYILSFWCILFCNKHWLYCIILAYIFI